MDDIKWFAGFLLVMGVLWLGVIDSARERPAQVATTTPAARTASPAPQSAPKQSGGAGVVAPRPVPGSGNVISDITLPSSAPDSGMSPLRGKLQIVSVQPNKSAQQEYITVQASSQNTKAIKITRLTVKSGVSLISHKIPRAWKLPFPEYTGGGEEDVTLRPGEQAYIISGRSPNGQSFQLNKCTGYFEQGMNFVPSLPLNCPRPVDDPLPLPPNALSDACYDYLTTLESCRVPPSSVPTGLRADGSCQTHIFNKINYNQCVTYYKNDRDFFQGEWHLYLDRSTRLWRDRREVVQLLDEDGKLISAWVYY